MDRLSSYSGGYNNQPIAGSARGFKMSIETRQKMSAAAKIVSSDPTERRRRSERALRQHAAGNLGRATYTESVQRKLEASLKEARKRRRGLKASEATKQKQRDAWTLERRAAQADPNIGRHRRGVVWTPEIRAKIMATWTPEKKARQAEQLIKNLRSK